ncbi:right-handed parallel beta-helix repeat-containing protein [Algisphaera agarilytica]|uniref:Pectate lyase superfamily protein n=1 Tax=Algisphaera agarilytica TaxID=1385975 RepID=A0A7X0HAI3_9BACT|nr:right-handed parallel beta-helix repeat-containing protein [Algisphaera agarilytica]MBB6430825.1 hypothetical protein [Algisphaera agarilytica]
MMKNLCVSVLVLSVVWLSGCTQPRVESGVSAGSAETAPPETAAFLNIRDFGAKGDGETDDTQALLDAMQAATESEGTVYFPHGIYMIHPVKVPNHITLLGYSAWAYGNKGDKDPDFRGKTILAALSGDARALLDLDDIRGTRIVGLTIDGRRQGERMHGIYMRHRGSELHNMIEDCRIEGFTGSGIRFERTWLLGVRRCMIAFNGEHGIDMTSGYDGWIMDTMLTGNKGWGLYIAGEPHEDLTDEERESIRWFGGASIMVTANRIEWNRAGGIYFNGANSMQITGCSIDHNFGPGMQMKNGISHTIVGNLFRSSGVEKKGDECSHLWLEDSRGVVVTGNTFWGKYNRTEYRFDYPYPFYGIIAKNLSGSVIADNAMYHAASKEGVRDDGGHTNTVIRDNAYVKPNLKFTDDGFELLPDDAPAE